MQRRRLYCFWWNKAMSMRYIACRVAYEGGSFHGSQLQDNASTVQQALEEAIEKVCCHPARVILAGRTDAGVHALGQCFRFATESTLPVERVAPALNANLDKSVRVWKAREVDETFHPRYSALSRTYRYWIENAALGNVLLAHAAAPFRESLDLRLMQRVAERLVGRHDFAAFQSAGSPTASTVRCIRRLQVRRRYDVLGSSLIEVEIEADAFLYRMVRNIVGILMAVGVGSLTPSDVTVLMDSKDRRQCPPPAPPQGLCLVDVKYNWEDF
jgi:tRNA pseudouridine38-40 synthase